MSHEPPLPQIDEQPEASPPPPAGEPKQLCMGDAHRITEILQAHFGPNGGRMHTAVEVGCHRGETSAKLLRQFPNLMLWMVDPYAATKKESPYYQSGDSIARLTRAEQHQHYLAARAATEFAANRRAFCKFPSVEAAKIIPTRKFSFVFCDGDHSLSGVQADIATWWPRVEAQGLLVLHDYGHTRNNGRGFGVRQAVDEFAELHGLLIETLGSLAFFIKP